MTKVKWKSEEDRCQIFPRGGHPDTRSAQEWWRETQNNLAKNRLEKAFGKIVEESSPRSGRRAVLCITNGKQYENMMVASTELGICRDSIRKHLQGVYTHAGRKIFRYID